MIILGDIERGTTFERIDRAVSEALAAFYGVTPAPARQQVIDAVAVAVAPYADRVTSIVVFVGDDPYDVTLEVVS